jgi:hypothetical protein
MLKKLCNKKAALIASVVAGSAVLLVEPASAASVLTAGMTSSLDTGFTDLKDMVADVIATVWPYMLAVLALYAAPVIVRKLWNLAAR